MEINSIGIIGGTNGLGARLAQYFADHFPETECLVSGRNTDITNKKIVQECDLVIFATPIDVTLEVMKSLVPESRSDQIWTDITSIKQAPVEMMCKSQSEVCGLHPLFGPLPVIGGQPLVYCPARISDENLSILLTLFERFDCLEMTPERHDELMGVVQCVSHLSDLVMGETLRQSGLDFETVWRVSSPSYRTKLQVMGRMFAQNPALYADIALSNPTALGFEAQFQKSTMELIDLIKAGDRDALIDRFTEVGNYLTEDFCRQAYATTQQFMSFSESTTPAQLDEKTGDIAVFGDRYSHTDQASWHFYPDRDDHQVDYFPNIESLVTAIDEERFRTGILPYENSNNGVVTETLDALFNYPGVQIVEHTSQSIDQHLITIHGSARDQITEVHSHPQALAQCRQWLKDNQPNAQVVPARSTAIAAQDLLGSQLKTRAVIGGAALAEGLGLSVLQKNINQADNVTRFIRVEKEPTLDTGASHLSLVFWFGDDQAGNLAGALQFMADKNINLIRLDARRADKTYGQYLFFVDAEVSLKTFKTLEAGFAAQVSGHRILGTFSV